MRITCLLALLNVSVGHGAQREVKVAGPSDARVQVSWLAHGGNLTNATRANTRVMAQHRGLCGVHKLTDTPSPDKCGATGFNATRKGVTSLEACVARCQACAVGKCGFATYSQRVRGGDCSLYASCDTQQLRHVSDYVTVDIHLRVDAWVDVESVNASAHAQRTQGSDGYECWPSPAPARSTAEEESVLMCPAPQPTARLVIYNRLAKAGSSTLLELMHGVGAWERDLARGKGRSTSYVMIAGDVNHERLSTGDQNRLVYRLVGKSTCRPVLFEQHIPYFAFAPFEAAEPTYIQLVREPTARWVSMHYFLRKCFCRKNNGPAFLWCSNRTQVYRMYDQSAMCAGDISEYYAARAQNRTYMLPDSNEMTRYFCGHSAVCWSADPAAREAASLLAWEHLRRRYVWVGVLEHLDESLRLLHAVLPNYMPSHVLQRHAHRPVIANARQETDSETPPDTAALAIIRAEIALDLHLYERALRLHQDRVRECVY